MLKFYKKALVLVFTTICSRKIEGLGVLGQPTNAECIGDDELLVVGERVNFRTAVDRCVELEAVLGVTFNQQEFDKVRDLGFEFGGDIYMGMS